MARRKFRPVLSGDMVINGLKDWIKLLTSVTAIVYLRCRIYMPAQRIDGCAKANFGFLRNAKYATLGCVVRVPFFSSLNFGSPEAAFWLGRKPPTPKFLAILIFFYCRGECVWQQLSFPKTGPAATPPIPDDLPKVDLTDNARQVLIRRYVRRARMAAAESVEENVLRVAYQRARVEEAWTAM